MEWSKVAGGSERQIRDVAGMLIGAGDSLDRDYLAKWVAELDLQAEFAAALE